MLDLWAEYGTIAVVVFLFVGQIQFLQKTLMGKLLEIEDIMVKLIDKHNRSDSDTFRKLDSIVESSERRHDSLTKEIDDLSDSVSFLKGRINGGSRG